MVVGFWSLPRAGADETGWEIGLMGKHEIQRDRRGREAERQREGKLTRVKNRLNLRIVGSIRSRVRDAYGTGISTPIRTASPTTTHIHIHTTWMNAHGTFLSPLLVFVSLPES